MGKRIDPRLRAFERQLERFLSGGPRTRVEIKRLKAGAARALRGHNPAAARALLRRAKQLIRQGVLTPRQVGQVLAREIRLDYDRDRAKNPGRVLVVPGELNAALRAMMLTGEPAAGIANNLVRALRASSPTAAPGAQRQAALYYGFPRKANGDIDRAAMQRLARDRKRGEIIFASNVGRPTQLNKRVQLKKGGAPPFDPRAPENAALRKGLPIRYAARLPVAMLEKTLLKGDAKTAVRHGAALVRDIIENEKFDYVHIDELRHNIKPELLKRLRMMMHVLARRKGMDQRLVFWLRLGTPPRPDIAAKYRPFLNTARLHARSLALEVYPDGKSITQRAVYGERARRFGDDVVKGKAEWRIEQTASMLDRYTPGINAAAITAVGVFLKGNGFRYGAVTQENYRNVLNQMLTVVNNGRHARYQSGAAFYALPRFTPRAPHPVIMKSKPKSKQDVARAVARTVARLKGQFLKFVSPKFWM